MTPNLPLVDAKHTRRRPEQDPNETPSKPPEISNLCVMVCELVQECATPCKPMQGYLDFCKGFRVKVYEGRFYEIQDCVNVLALNGVVLGFNHVLFIFFTRVILISRELVNLLASICHV